MIFNGLLSSWNEEGFFYFKQDNVNYDLSGPSGYKLQNNDKIKNKNDFTVFYILKVIQVILILNRLIIIV